MKKGTIKHILILLVFFCNPIAAQEDVMLAKYGKLMYKSMFDSSKEPAPSVMIDYEREAKKNLEDVEFELLFTKTKSVFSIIERLGKSDEEKIGTTNMDEGEIIYVDLQKDERLVQNTAFDQQFLISGQAFKQKWNLIDETKKIGNYICYKATSILTIQNSVGTFNHQITAWYTPDLPFSHGPNGYVGLPGLIIELDIHVFTYFLKELDLKGKKNLIIQKPVKGKKVTQDEYDKWLIKISKNIPFDSF
jgi:GLPGLI family protein